MKELYFNDSLSIFSDWTFNEILENHYGSKSLHHFPLLYN